jgi:SAM-dependent methyltransferase
MDLSAQNRTYHVTQGSMELLPNYYRWMYSKFQKHIRGSVLELGCGAGIGIKCYLDKADHVYAVDHNPELLKQVASKYAAEKVTPMQADLINEWDFLPEGSADTILIMDAVEHFKDDQLLIRKAAAILAPAGKLLIKVPAQPRLYSSIDEASGHYRRYDAPALRQLAQQAGLTIEKITNSNAIGSMAYRFKRQKKRNFSGTFSGTQLKLINVTIPLIRMTDILPLPGLSLLCVMTRSKDT